MQNSIENIRSRTPAFSITAPAQVVNTALADTAPFSGVEPATAAFVDAYPMPAAVVNDRLFVQHGNEQFRTHFTDSYLKLRETTIAASLGAAPGEPLNAAVQRTLETGQIQRCTVSITDHGANTVTAQVDCVPVQLTADERGCMCFIHLPATPNPAAEQERTLNEFKSRLYAMIVHDFRTPLFAIRTAATTLGLFFDKMDKRRRDSLVKTIEQSVDDLAGFLSDIEMINTARSNGLQIQSELVDAQDMCITLIREMQAFCNDSHVFSFNAPQQQVQLSADKRLLSRAIRNLLSNAIKFSPQGSQVRLDVIQSEHEVLFRVQDQGIGIPLNEHMRVFDTFYRAKNVGGVSGSGLGLALVKYAVLQQGGTIDVESNVGVGTTITLHFPTPGQ